jgi:hypothetical protein
MPERAVDHPGYHSEVTLTPCQAPELGVHDLVERHALPLAEMRTIADLEISYIVARRVFHHLIAHPFERLGRLQQRDGEVEPVQVILQIGGVIYQHEPPERLRLVGGQRDLCLAGQLDHGFRTQRAVQVDVKLRLGKTADELTRQHRRSEPWPVPRPAGWRRSPAGSRDRSRCPCRR